LWVSVRFPKRAGLQQIEKLCGPHAATFNKRGLRVRADARQEVMQLLQQAGRGKTARKIAEKFEKTNTLSKRDIKILRDLVYKRARVAA